MAAFSLVQKSSKISKSPNALTQAGSIKQRTLLDPEKHVDANEMTALVQASQQGDRVAFGRLVYGFQRPAMEFTVRLLWDRELAEEVVQASFVKAWVKIRQLCRPAGFQSWFFHIVMNTALNHLRHRRRQREFFPCGSNRNK